MGEFALSETTFSSKIKNEVGKYAIICKLIPKRKKQWGNCGQSFEDINSVLSCSLEDKLNCRNY